MFLILILQALKSDEGNLLISPLGVNYALTVTSLAAEGNTLKELRTTLNQPDDYVAIVSSYRVFIDSIDVRFLHF